MNPALLAAMRPRVRFVTQSSDTAPGQPTNLRTTSVSPTAVALAWAAPDTGGAVTSYELLRGGVVIQTGITGLSVVDSTVTAGQGYSYTVRATGPGGTGPESAALAVEVPGEGGGDAIDLLHGVMGPPSATGVTIKYKSAIDADGVQLAYSTDPTLQTGVQYTAPQNLNAANYRTYTVTLTDLLPDTEYTWAPYAGGELVQRAGAFGRFRTAPVGPKSFSIAFSNCNQYSGGAPRDLTVWDHIREQAPAFFCHLDDFHYGDYGGTDVATRVLYDENQMAQPRQGGAYMQVPLVRGIGDHDGAGNDWASTGDGSVSSAVRQSMLDAYGITMPDPVGGRPSNDGLYYAFTWGRVRVIKLDTRFFRNYRYNTGSKTMLGSAQMSWLEGELGNAAAAIEAGTLGLIVITSDVPWTGSGNSSADHWEGYAANRQQVANLIENAGLTGNVYMIVGDMHRMGYDSGVNTRFSTANAGQPAFPSACGGSLGNAQGDIKGEWTNVEGSGTQNRVGFLLVEDDGGDEITVTTSLRAVDTGGTSYTQPLGSFVDTFPCAPAGGTGEIDHPPDALALIGSIPVVARRHFNALDEADEITGTRWNDSDGFGSGVNSTLRIQPDPLNPSNSVGWLTYPVGYSGNGTTSHQARADAPWSNRNSGWIYVRFRYYYSENWYGQDGSAINKTWYIGHPIVPVSVGGGYSTMHLRLALQGGENFNGSWNHAENQASPTSAQAEMRRGEWTDVALAYWLGTPGQYNGQMHAWMRHPQGPNVWVKTHQFVNRRLLAASGMYAVVDFLSWRPIYGGQNGTNIFEEQYQAMDFCEVRAG